MADRDSLKLLPQSALTPYDVLGYVAPGTAVLIAVLIFETYTQIAATGTLHVHRPVYSAVGFILSQLRSTTGWVLSALLLIGALAIVYLVGHVVASISALFIERLYIERSHGYPFELFLNVSSTISSNPNTKPYYRALFFWANAYILLRYWATWQNMLDHATAPTSLVLFVTRTIAWAVVVLTLAKFLVSVPYGRRRTWLVCALETRVGRGFAWVVRVMMKLGATPYDMLVNPLGTFLHTRDPFDNSFVLQYNTAFERLFKMKPAEVGTNNFWFSLIHLREQSPQLAEPAENWHRLYSFARNLSAALYLAFLYCLVWLLWQGRYLGNLSRDNAIVLIAVPLVFFVAAVAMLIRYYYLYAGYYTKYVFRCFVYLSRMPPEPSKSG